MSKNIVIDVNNVRCIKSARVNMERYLRRFQVNKKRLIGPYSVTAKKRLSDDTIVDHEYKLTCMTFLDPVTGWFEIAEVPQYLVKDIKTDEFRESIDKSSARISQIFNNVWLSRYPLP